MYGSSDMSFHSIVMFGNYYRVPIGHPLLGILQHRPVADEHCLSDLNIMALRVGHKMVSLRTRCGGCKNEAKTDVMEH